jgi:hypothetical protein
MDGVTQDQMRASLFPFSLLGSFAMVPRSTDRDGAKLEHIDEGLHEGILLVG